MRRGALTLMLQSGISIMTSEPEAGQNLTEENGEVLEVREQEGGRKQGQRRQQAEVMRGHNNRTGGKQTNRHTDTHNGISTTYYCGISERSSDGNTLLQCYYITITAAVTFVYRFLVVITAFWL